MGPSQFDHEKLDGLVVLQRIEPGKAMLFALCSLCLCGEFGFVH
jgi:hypothetical protein